MTGAELQGAIYEDWIREFFYSMLVLSSFESLLIALMPTITANSLRI